MRAAVVLVLLGIVASAPAVARAECAPWKPPGPSLYPVASRPDVAVEVPPEPVLYLTSYRGEVEVRITARGQAVELDRAVVESSLNYRVETVRVHVRDGAFRVELAGDELAHWYVVSAGWKRPAAPAIVRIGSYRGGTCGLRNGFPIHLTDQDAMLQVRWSDGVAHHEPVREYLSLGDGTCTPPLLPPGKDRRTDFELAAVYPDGSVVDLRWAFPLSPRRWPHLVDGVPQPLAVVLLPRWVPYVLALLAIGLLGTVVALRRRARARTIVP